MIGQFPATDQCEYNGSTNDSGQDEAIDAVPAGCPASPCSANVDVVEAYEAQELGDEGALDGHQDGGPGDGGSDDTDGIALVALVAAKAELC